MWSGRWLARTFAYAVGEDLFWVPDSDDYAYLNQ